MACCGSGDIALIIAGPGIIVEGTGQVGNPYVVALESGQVSLTVADTDTVDMSIIGDGTQDSPFVLSANATISMSTLTDVDPSNPPESGDVPIFDGSLWVFGPPPSTPPGAVNVGPGIEGDGSFPDPIRIAVSDLVTTDVGGLATYIDSADELRAVPPTWAQVTDIPPLDAATIDGRHLFVQSADPIGSAVEGDMWFEEL